MNIVGPFIEIRATNYAKIRKAIQTMSSKTWYRGIIRDTATSTLQDFVSYASKVTHKLTGLLSESHIWTYDSHSSIGRVYINPRIAARRGQSTVVWPKLYGVYEHDRGGSHAFYDRTLTERGANAVDYGLRALVGGIPKV